MIQHDTKAALESQRIIYACMLGTITLDSAADKTAYLTAASVHHSIVKALGGTSQYTAEKVLRLARECPITRDDILQYRLDNGC